MLWFGRVLVFGGFFFIFQFGGVFDGNLEVLGKVFIGSERRVMFGIFLVVFGIL